MHTVLYCMYTVQYMGSATIITIYVNTCFYNKTNAKLIILSILISGARRSLKWQCREIFGHFLKSKSSTWAPYKQAKPFCKLFMTRLLFHHTLVVKV